MEGPGIFWLLGDGPTFNTATNFQSVALGNAKNERLHWKVVAQELRLHIQGDSNSKQFDSSESKCHVMNQ